MIEKYVIDNVIGYVINSRRRQYGDGNSGGKKRWNRNMFSGAITIFNRQLVLVAKTLLLQEI
jgi:hypothetical protein